ncbi:MAG TPA: hypothetical protein PKC67_12915 [Kiritimatiellia bacterium]|nr:hypothetical protein [Kiritimatiellia bacterium]HMP35238.1 hypothetical protein [Kiritimatiellia bacterium]
MTKRAGIAAGLMLCAVFMTGCAIPSASKFGNDFDHTKQEAIVKGKTTKQELIGLLGQPQDKTLDSGAKEKWIYVYAESNVRVNPWNNAATGDVRTKKLEVMFDDEVVANFVYSDSTVPAESTRR